MWLFLEEKATQRACRWVQLFWFCCSGQDVFPDFVKQWRSFVLARKMTRGATHLFLARLVIQLKRQLQDAGRVPH
jgi:hypothetical protein